MSTRTTPTSKLGYVHYVLFPDDGRRHEIIHGDHYMTPAPSTAHQTISKRLQYELYTRIELAGLGIIFAAPFDVQLSEHDIVQPDLVVVLNAKKSIIIPSRIRGIPDLLVEILSPSNPAHDEVLKREMYQRSGVPEYWIVDPAERLLTQLVLQDGVYQPNAVTDQVRLSTLDAISIPVLGIWE